MSQILIQRIYPSQPYMTISYFIVDSSLVNNNTIDASTYNLLSENRQSTIQNENEFNTMYSKTSIKMINKKIRKHGFVDIATINNQSYIVTNNGTNYQLNAIKLPSINMFYKYAYTAGILFSLLIPSILTYIL